MADDIGCCINCGFLGKRRTIIDAESIVYPASSYDRQQGIFNRHSGWPDQRDMPTQIACFRNAANLPKELEEALAKAERQDTDAKNEHTRIIIEKSRKCKSWYPWTEYLTPKEHFDEFKEEINRKERRRTNRIMIWLTISLIFFAVVQVVITILGIINNS